MVVNTGNVDCCFLGVGHVLHIYIPSIILSQVHFSSWFMDVGSETMTGMITKDRVCLCASSVFRVLLQVVLHKLTSLIFTKALIIISALEMEVREVKNS